MTRLRIANAGFVAIGSYFEPFEVGKYRFSSMYPRPEGWPDSEGFSGNLALGSRVVRCTAHVEFVGRQENSILFHGGGVGSKKSPHRRKLIDDVLLLASIVTGRNWELFSRRKYPNYSVTNANHLECVVPETGGTKVGKVIEQALACIDQDAWQSRFEKGFHLRMLKNHANILTTEVRFLSLVIIWEWLYAHLKSSAGATVADESKALREVFVEVLEEFWPGQVNRPLISHENVFYVLRNQLAHCGRLPIDRQHAFKWMKQLHCDFQFLSAKGTGVADYLRFFQYLTQVVVLKTLGIDAESKLEAWSFKKNLHHFLQTGRLPGCKSA